MSFNGVVYVYEALKLTKRPCSEHVKNQRTTEVELGAMSPIVTARVGITSW